MQQKKHELIPFRFTLAALQAVRLTDNPNFDGLIGQVEIHWPAGCNALVQVAVYKNTERFIPREGYIALNDVTRTYPSTQGRFDIPVTQRDNIIVEILNGDAVNPHTISVNVDVYQP